MRRPPAETPRLYEQDGKGYGATVYAHYFAASHDWLVTEYDPDQDIAFGWACLNGDRQNAELGYTSLAELEQVQWPVLVGLGDQTSVAGYLGIEMEEGWQQMELREAIALLDERQGREA